MPWAYLLTKKEEYDSVFLASGQQKTLSKFMKWVSFLGLGVLTLNSFFTPPAQADCTTPPSGLVGWWAAEGNVHDAVGANDGIWIGTASYTNGETGLAFNFDGASRVQIPDAPAMHFTSAMTVEAWINLKTFSGDNSREIVSKLDGPTDNSKTFTLSIDPALGTAYFIVCTTNGLPGEVRGSTTIPLNQWVHLVGTYDGSSVKIYFNGQLDGSTPWTQAIFPGSNPLVIGCTLQFTSSSPTSFFNGAIDEVSLYNRALTTNEIAAIYNAGSAGKCAISCTPAPTGVVGWWPAEGNANDIINNNNGTLVGGVTFTNGEVGQSFVFDGATGSIRVPASPALDVGQGNGFTLEMWCNPTTTNATGVGVMTLAEWNDNSGAFTGIGCHLEFYNGGVILADVVDSLTGNDHFIQSAAGNVTPNSWQHVAMTYSKTNGVLTLYRNGVAITNGNVGIWTPSTAFDLYFGERAAGVFSPIPYQGLLDEPTIYNRALSSNEIAAIYNAGSAGKCDEPLPPGITVQPVNQTAMEGSNVVLSVTASGTGPFSYQWRFNGINISGATGATLTLTNLHPYQSGIYTVAVTSPYGTVTSSNTTVTVPAQTILIYAYSGTEKITTSGQSVANAYSGELFFIPDTTNGTFVGWSTIKGKKQYWINPLSDYLLITVSGAAKETYTVLGQAGQGIDDNGYPHLWSDLHKGQNTQLTIGKKKYFLFPNTLADTSTHVYPDPLTGNMVLNEAVSNYSFLSQNTQAANNNGQTMTDLVNALVKSLVSQGYQSQ